MNEITGAGEFNPGDNYDVRESTADITGIDQEGDLHLYGGAQPTGLYNGDVIGTDWNIFKNLI